MKVLIDIAACNEALSLDQFLPRLLRATEDLPGDILVIDDGSSDSTSEVSKKYGCMVVRNKENFGVGTSLRRGYKVAVKDDYDVVISMDADGQHDQDFLGKMLDEIYGGADIVMASRYHPDSERIEVPLDRDLLNVAVAAQMRIVTGWKITDPLCGFWAMRR